MDFFKKIQSTAREANDRLANASKEWRDESLKAREQALSRSEAECRKREIDLELKWKELQHGKMRRRVLTAIAPFFCIAIFIFGVVIGTYFFAGSSTLPEQSTVKPQEKTTALGVPQPNTPIGPGALTDASTKGMDVDAAAKSGKYGTGSDFNVGRYCLDKEKEGGISFESCVGASAAAISQLH